MSVLPNGLSIGCSKHYPGSVSDIEIFRQGKTFHEEQSEKHADENIESDEVLSEEYPEMSVIIVDKGYQGSSQFYVQLYQ